MSSPRNTPSHPSPTSNSEPPQRSRNARAQARHRAKRKAYIEQVSRGNGIGAKHMFIPSTQFQLETTVTKLQVALALSPEQVAALPAPVIRIRELEEENEILHRELDELRRQLEDRNARLRPDLARRHMPSSPYDRGEYDSRRRRLTDSTVYLVRVVELRIVVVGFANDDFLFSKRRTATHIALLLPCSFHRQLPSNRNKLPK